MSTQKAFFSYEEVIDLHTESEKVSVIGIHTPTGSTPRKLCPGFFEQFKRYKYLGCKIALVPAATLPADPLQISYEAGEPSIDPRDMLNPILWHGCHGNDLGDILNRLYAANAVTGDSSTMHLGSDAVDMVSYLNDDAMDFFGEISTNISFMESLYYRALTDRTWKKANVQRGFRIAGLRPRVYSLASTFQISGVASLDAIGQVPSPFEIDVDVDSITPPIGSIDIGNGVSNANRFLTPRTVPLGWLDTRSVLTTRASTNVSLDADDVGLAPSVIDTMVSQGTVPVELPKIFMGVILLPPAYKQEFYFRMIVTHYFAFAGFRGVSMSNDMLENPNYHDWNDNITNGTSDDPTPDPTPARPPADATYPCVFLSEQQDATKYSKAEYYTAADTVSVSIEFPNDGGAFSVGASGFAVGMSVLTTVATKGTSVGQVSRIQCAGTNSVRGTIGATSWGSVNNVADISSFLGGVIDSSEFVVSGSGTDGKTMFLSTTIYKEDDL